MLFHVVKQISIIYTHFTQFPNGNPSLQYQATSFGVLLSGRHLLCFEQLASPLHLGDKSLIPYSFLRWSMGVGKERERKANKSQNLGGKKCGVQSLQDCKWDGGKRRDCRKWLRFLCWTDRRGCASELKRLGRVTWHNFSIFNDLLLECKHQFWTLSWETFNKVSKQLVPWYLSRFVKLW